MPSPVTVQLALSWILGSGVLLPAEPAPRERMKPAAPPTEGTSTSTSARAALPTAVGGRYPGEFPSAPGPEPGTPGGPRLTCEQLNERGLEAPRRASANGLGSIVSPGLGLFFGEFDAPNPSRKQLKRTRWARRDRRPGCNQTHFCVTPDGFVRGVTTVVSFHDDAEIDAIFSKTVRAWRFAPLPASERRRDRCTTVEFHLSHV